MSRQLSACRRWVLPPAEIKSSAPARFYNTKRKNARKETKQEDAEREIWSGLVGGPSRAPEDPSHVHESPPESQAETIDLKRREDERNALLSDFGGGRPSAPDRGAKAASHVHQSRTIGHVFDWGQTEQRENEHDKREREALRSAFGGGRPHIPNRKAKDPAAGSHIHQPHPDSHAHVINWKETEWGKTDHSKRENDALHSVFGRQQREGQDSDASSVIHESDQGSHNGNALDGEETEQSKMERNVAPIFEMLNTDNQKRIKINELSKRERDAPDSTADPPPPFRDLWGLTSHQFLGNKARSYTNTYRKFHVQGMQRAAKRIMFPGPAGVSLEKAAENLHYRDIRATANTADSHLIFRLYFDTASEAKYDIPGLRVANRVAAMALARSLGLPVPKVLEYDCTENNSIGSPYIAFEEPDGAKICSIWTDLNDEERLKLVDELADIEARLLSLELPGFGAIYFSRDLPPGRQSFPIPDRGDLKGLCVGPFCTNMGRFIGHEPRDGGPFISPEVFAYNNAMKIPVIPDALIHHGVGKQDFSSQKSKLYGDYLKVVDYLLPRMITAISAPRLSAYILLKTNFAHVNFTQSRNVKIAAAYGFGEMAEPALLLWGDNLMRRLRPSTPRMPRQPETISHKRQELIAKQLMGWRRAMMETRFFDKIKHIEESHSTLSIPNWQLLRELFIAIKAYPTTNPIHLHAALINVTEHWDDLARTEDGSVPPCPISYSEKEKKDVLREQERNDAHSKEFFFISEITETSASEWVVSTENYIRVRDYARSIGERVEANGGKYYPDVDESDSTDEVFETPDEFETVLCRRMGISRATFWRSVADTAVWRKNNSLNQREGYFEEKSRVGVRERPREKDKRGLEKEEKKKEERVNRLSLFIDMMK